MKKLEIRAIRSDGIILNYENCKNGITLLEGLSLPSVEIFKKERGKGNGEIVTGERILGRVLKISVTSKNHDKELAREEAETFHNPFFSYDIEITYLGKTRIIKEARLESYIAPTNNVNNFHKFEIQYYCQDPYLHALEEEMVIPTESIPMHHTPMIFGDFQQTIFGIVKENKKEKIMYSGVVPVGINITITATGLCQGFKVTLTNREVNVSADIRQMLDTDDTLFISTLENKLKLTYNGESLPLDLYADDIPKLEKIRLATGLNDVDIECLEEGNRAFEYSINYDVLHGGI